MATQSNTAANLQKELHLTRIFDAPREVVFQAWTDAKQLARWWGPKGFTNPVCEIDPRPGGAINIHMHAPYGEVYPMGGIFHEITPPDRIVFTSKAFLDGKGNAELEVMNTITFAEHNGKTKLTLHAKVVKATPMTAQALSGMDQGWNESLDRLAALVAKA